MLDQNNDAHKTNRSPAGLCRSKKGESGMPAKSDWGGSWIQPAGRDADTVGDGSRAVANGGHILAVHRPSDGRPHVTPLIAVWRTNALRFATGPEERKARNLAENSWCVLTTGRSDLVGRAFDVVLEGRPSR